MNKSATSAETKKSYKELKTPPHPPPPPRNEHVKHISFNGTFSACAHVKLPTRRLISQTRASVVTGMTFWVGINWDRGDGWRRMAGGGADTDADRKRLAEKGQEGCPEQRMEGGGEGAHEGGDAHVAPPTLSSAAITQQKKRAKIKENPPKMRTEPTFGRFREDHEIHVGRKSN